MSYAVQLLPEARDALSFLIAGARDGEYLSECVVRIYDRLKSDPYGVGERVSGPSGRRMSEGSLSALYYVDDFMQRVQVVAVRRVRSPL